MTSPASPECCAGTGFLLDQTYGCTVLPAGARPVQRCDACDQIPGDLEAAHAAAAAETAAGRPTIVGAYLRPDGQLVEQTDPWIVAVDGAKRFVRIHMAEGDEQQLADIEPGGFVALGGLLGDAEVPVRVYRVVDDGPGEPD